MFHVHSQLPFHKAFDLHCLFGCVIFPSKYEALYKFCGSASVYVHAIFALLQIDVELCMMLNPSVKPEMQKAHDWFRRLASQPPK